MPSSTSPLNQNLIKSRKNHIIDHCSKYKSKTLIYTSKVYIYAMHDTNLQSFINLDRNDTKQKKLALTFRKLYVCTFSQLVLNQYRWKKAKQKESKLKIFYNPTQPRGGAQSTSHRNARPPTFERTEVTCLPLIRPVITLLMAYPFYRGMLVHIYTTVFRSLKDSRSSWEAPRLLYNGMIKVLFNRPYYCCSAILIICA